MRLKHVITTCFAAGFLFLTNTTTAQISTPAPSPAASLSQTIGLTEVDIEYSRPGVKGRTIFGDLVPYGKIWRTGANAATKISFSDDVTVNGAALKAGTYALYTIPGESTWTVLIYSDLSIGGNVRAYDEANEVARFETEAIALPQAVESMMFLFDEVKNESAELMLLWDKTAINMTIEVDADEAVMSQIEQTMAGPSANDYYAAATYYYTTDRDMNQALEWIQACIDNGGDRYWIHTWKARILGKMGNTTEAIATAEMAKAMAEEAGNPDYVKINADLIAEWSN